LQLTADQGLSSKFFALRPTSARQDSQNLVNICLFCCPCFCCPRTMVWPSVGGGVIEFSRRLDWAQQQQQQQL
jgi:hypothetical protein